MSRKNAAPKATRAAHTTAAAAVKPQRPSSSDEDRKRWGSVAAAYTGTVHVYPLYGPRHTMSLACWCHPSEEPGEERIVVHNVAH